MSWAILFGFLLTGIKEKVLVNKNKPYDEVLGAAQYTERTMHQCPKLSSVVTTEVMRAAEQHKQPQSRYTENQTLL